MVLYLHEKKRKMRGVSGDRFIHIFHLTSDPEGKNSVTKFVHDDSEEAHQRSLDYLVRWAKQANVTIGNPEAWQIQEVGKGGG